MGELDETWAFEAALQDRCAERRESFEWGTALFQPDMPRVHDQNLLRLERGLDSASAKELAAAADRLQRPAGLSHRKILVPNEVAGERLSPGFAELSWRRARHVVMLHRGEPPPEPAHPVREVPAEALRESRIRAFEEDLGQGAAGQVAAALELAAAAAASSSSFAVEADGALVSWCVMYQENGIAQIDDVVTDPGYRQRGYAKAVVAAATRRSVEAGDRLTFLVADDEDWPKEMYARLGFEPIGRRYEFTRL